MTKPKQKPMDWRIGSVGLICVTALTLGALAMGYDGLVLKIGFVLIGGIVGVVIPNPFKK